MSPQSPPPRDEDEADAETERRPLRAQLVPLVIAVVVLVALMGSVVYLLSGKTDAMKPATFVQTVTLKPLPPPPRRRRHPRRKSRNRSISNS